VEVYYEHIQKLAHGLHDGHDGNHRSSKTKSKSIEDIFICMSTYVV
jgi:hypothetical protein